MLYTLHAPNYIPICTHVRKQEIKQMNKQSLEIFVDGIKRSFNKKLMHFLHRFYYIFLDDPKILDDVNKILTPFGCKLEIKFKVKIRSNS